MLVCNLLNDLTINSLNITIFKRRRQSSNINIFQTIMILVNLKMIVNGNIHIGDNNNGPKNIIDEEREGKGE